MTLPTPPPTPAAQPDGCVDLPMKDMYNYDCSMYRTLQKSKDYDYCGKSMLATWNSNAGEKCCVCGGGSGSAPALPTPPPTPAPAGTCTDLTKNDGSVWDDGTGYGCKIYFEHNMCGPYGSDSQPKADKACCQCGGGQTAVAASDDDDDNTHSKLLTDCPRYAGLSKEVHGGIREPNEAEKGMVCAEWSANEYKNPCFATSTSSHGSCKGFGDACGNPDWLTCPAEPVGGNGAEKCIKCGAGTRQIGNTCVGTKMTCHGVYGKGPQTAYNPSLPCQCNSLCSKYGNCCGDYESWRSSYVGVGAPTTCSQCADFVDAGQAQGWCQPTGDPKTDGYCEPTGAGIVCNHAKRRRLGLGDYMRSDCSEWSDWTPSYGGGTTGPIDVGGSTGFCQNKNCPTYYQPSWRCQCNDLCKKYGNCCDDAHTCKGGK